MDKSTPRDEKYEKKGKTRFFRVPKRFNLDFEIGS